MIASVLFGLSALLALVPWSLVVWRRSDVRPEALFWLTFAVAVVGPLAWVVSSSGLSWRTGLSAALWITVVATLVTFGVIAAITRDAWRLAPLFGPYMIAVAAIAVFWQHAPERVLAWAQVSAWLEMHIIVSVLTYALVTIAAVAALAATIQEAALKAKRPNTLTRRLPSVADCERLLLGILLAGEAVLALGLASGMAAHYRDSGTVLGFDHKTVLSVAAFVVIGCVLLAHYQSGLRGRRAARFVLLAYLLITFGYPGVKFVTDVIMA